MRRLEEAVKQAVLGRRFESEGLDPQRIRMLSKIDLNMDAQRLGERGRGGAGEGAMALAYGIALLLYMSIMLYGQAIMMGVIEEKSQRVAEVVVAAIPPDKLLAGKVLGVGAVGMTQQLVWVGSALTLMNFRKPIEAALGLSAGMPAFTLPSVSLGTALLFLCFFVLGYTLFATLFAAAGSMVSSTQDAQQVATPLVMLIIPSLLLLPPVLFAPNGSLARTVSMIPFSAPILMPVRMSLTTVSPLELVGSLLLLLLTCLGAMWLAARIYRTGVLMYGKKPSMREVLHWIRVAR
ncbi:MAG: ABC transporter permease [Gemmatimonadetes bacterium]|nr:ABC transporter permease [Gemmatimonadota bacterium]